MTAKRFCMLAAVPLFSAVAVMWLAPGRAEAQAAPSASAAVPPPRISRVDESKYTVEGNIAYDKYPDTVLDMIYAKGGGPDAKTDSPGVIMFHGGGWIESGKATMSSFYNRFLAHGFVVCNVEYRMAGEDRQHHALPGSATAPAAVEDALDAAKWFWDHADHYHVDKTRFIVTGASAGGHLALMVGLCTPAGKLGPTSPADFKIAAIVNGYGPTDLPDLLARHVSWARQWLPASTPNAAELAKRVSPITYVRKDAPPLLTVQGSNDHTVPVEQNQRLVDALKAAGADATIHLVPGAGHGYARPATAWPDAEHEIFDVWLPAHHIIPAK